MIIFLFFNNTSVKSKTLSNIFLGPENLNSRKDLWPNWKLPFHDSKGLSSDLIYPFWFEGKWLVEAKDEANPEDNYYYEVIFYKDQLGRIVADREYNSKSIAKSILNLDLKVVQNDPLAFNGQITFISSKRFIESKVISRSQIDNDNYFLADELVIQNFHELEASRLSQIETMTEFYLCGHSSKVSAIKPNICGIQIQANYGSRIGDHSVNAINSSKLSMRLTPIAN